MKEFMLRRARDMTNRRPIFMPDIFMTEDLIRMHDSVQVWLMVLLGKNTLPLEEVWSVLDGRKDLYDSYYGFCRLVHLEPKTLSFFDKTLQFSFRISVTVENKVHIYHCPVPGDAGPISAWIREGCGADPDNLKAVLWAISDRNGLWESYCGFCKSIGKTPLSRRLFNNELKHRYGLCAKRITVNGVKAYHYAVKTPSYMDDCEL